MQHTSELPCSVVHFVHDDYIRNWDFLCNFLRNLDRNVISSAPRLVGGPLDMKTMDLVWHVE